MFGFADDEVDDDVYIFNGTGGRTLVVDVDAELFLSEMDPVVELYDDNGGFLFGVDDTDGLDPRFNIQSDKLTVFIHKEEGEGLEKAVAEGHVGVVRDKPDPKGGPPSKAVGLSEKAVYTSSDGNVVLTGSPRVQQGLDTHIATTPDTVMVLNQDGHLTTHGPSRTEIRQETKNTENAKPSPSPTTPVKKP